MLEFVLIVIGFLCTVRKAMACHCSAGKTIIGMLSRLMLHCTSATTPKAAQKPLWRRCLRHTVGGKCHRATHSHSQHQNPPFFLAFLLVKGKVPPHQRQPNSNTKVAGFRLFAPCAAADCKHTAFPFRCLHFDTSTGAAAAGGGGSLAFALRRQGFSRRCCAALCPSLLANTQYSPPASAVLRYGPNKDSRRVFDASGTSWASIGTGCDCASRGPPAQRCSGCSS